MINKILVIGDSLVYGKWDAEGGWVSRLRRLIDSKLNFSANANILVYNLGIPGEVSLSTSSRVENELEMRILASDEPLLIVSVGLNDSCENNRTLGRQSTPEEFQSSIIKILEVSNRLKCKVLLLGLTPPRPELSKGLLFKEAEVKKYDSLLCAVANSQKVSYLHLYTDLENLGYKDLLVDSVHPNSAGHELILQYVIAKLKEHQIDIKS